jgi:rhodanese-related sulfurtransferase
MLAEARKEVPEITATQAKQRLDSGQVDLILDVREPNEWNKGHIPGAMLAPRGLLEWYADPTSSYAKPELTENQDARIVVHCAAGARSLLAAQTLKKMGYSNVVSMAGGFTDWAARGFPVESSET